MVKYGIFYHGPCQAEWLCNTSGLIFVFSERDDAELVQYEFDRDPDCPMEIKIYDGEGETVEYTGWPLPKRNV